MATQKERADAIIESTKRAGFPIDKNHRLISFWELAGELNNCWQAKRFVGKEHCSKEYQPRMLLGKDWVVDSWNHHVYRRMIRWTINRMDGSVTVTKGYPEWFKIKIISK